MEAGTGVHDLAGRIQGQVVTPGNDGWDEARLPWNLVADQRPEAVVKPAGPEDVAATITFARDAGMRVTAQSLGHGSAALGSLDETILLRMTGLDSIEIDPERQVAKVGAGVLMRDALQAAGEHGLAALSGSSPNVSVVPYSLGGGLSWLGRPHGLSCSNVRSIDVVTADGEIRTIDADNEPDLFWAMRGGGGNFGIATAMEINLFPHREVYAGTMIFPPDNAAQAFRAWRDWSETVPDEMTSICRILTPPDIPDVPEPLRGRMVLTLGMCYVGDPADGPELAAPMRALGEPIMDFVGPMPAAGLCEIHMDPEPAVPAHGHHAQIRELPDEAIDAFLGEVGPGSDTPLLLAELRHAGGALGEVPDGAGALGSLDGAYVMLAIGLPMAPEMEAPIHAGLDDLYAAMEPWRSEAGYMNFADRPMAPEGLFPPETLARLRDVKSKWDPDNLIRANHDLN